MRRVLILCGLTVLGCSTEPETFPPPEVSGVAPDTLPLLADSVFITVSGAGFAWTSWVEWDSLMMPTTVESSGQMRAMVRAGQTDIGGTHQVRVRTPPPGGGMSASLPVIVTNPAPQIDSIVPDSAVAGAGTWLGSIWGRNFVLTASDVLADGVPLEPWTFTRTRFDVAIPPDQLTVPRTITITVVNPAPGGGSSTAPFRVVAPP